MSDPSRLDAIELAVARLTKELVSLRSEVGRLNASGGAAPNAVPSTPPEPRGVAWRGARVELSLQSPSPTPELPDSLVLHLGQHSGPYPGLAPAPKPGVHRVPGSEPLGWQVAPRHATPGPPKHGLDEQACIAGRRARRLRLPRQERRKSFPLRIGQHTAVFIHAQRSALIVNTP